MRFQESLGLVCQGTGVGLSLCKHLASLLHADLALDESFDSGVPGCPGTRFVLNLNTSPVTLDDDGTSITHSSTLKREIPFGNQEDEDPEEMDTESRTAVDSVNGATNQLPRQNSNPPTTYSVLFVEDDFMLRKLFSRTLRRVCPTWKFVEAASGEAALKILDSTSYDLIFVDQYMSSTTKQLLGSETVREMRSRGVTSIVCGLSANDAADDFLAAGADAFVLKPFPCEKEAMSRELHRVLKSKRASYF